MKKLAWLAAVLFFCGVGKAQAEPAFDVGYSSFVVVSVDVTTQTAVLVNSRPAGWTYGVGFYRFINNASAASAWHMWLGGSDVDTAGKGELLAAGGSKSEWKVNKDRNRNGALVPIYAVAANSATVTTLPKLTVIWFGF
jgi:hypothetical protein